MHRCLWGKSSQNGSANENHEDHSQTQEDNPRESIGNNHPYLRGLRRGFRLDIPARQAQTLHLRCINQGHDCERHSDGHADHHHHPRAEHQRHHRMPDVGGGSRVRCSCHGKREAGATGRYPPHHGTAGQCPASAGSRQAWIRRAPHAPSTPASARAGANPPCPHARQGSIRRSHHSP